LDGESPDIVTTSAAGKRIGIELTEFFHGTAPRGGVSQVQREAFQRMVVQEAQRDASKRRSTCQGELAEIPNRRCHHESQGV
jgi:hypothetical protein